MAARTRSDTMDEIDLTEGRLPPDRARRLRVGNVVVGLVHAAQVVILLVLSTDFALPVTESFAAGPPGTAPPAPETLYDLPLGPAVAAFLALAALDHLLVASPGIHRWYEARLRAGINPARWLEYSVSASLMVSLIAMLSGILDLVALIGIFGVNAAMILFGMRMEVVNDQRSGDVDWWPFIYGCIAGIVPWVAIAFSIGGAEVESGEVPDVRVRDHREPVPVLQLLRRQPVPSVQAGGTLA